MDLHDPGADSDDDESPEAVGFADSRNSAVLQREKEILSFKAAKGKKKEADRKQHSWFHDQKVKAPVPQEVGGMVANDVCVCVAQASFELERCFWEPTIYIGSTRFRVLALLPLSVTGCWFQVAKILRSKKESKNEDLPISKTSTTNMSVSQEHESTETLEAAELDEDADMPPLPVLKKKSHAAKRAKRKQAFLDAGEEKNQLSLESIWPLHL